MLKDVLAFIQARANIADRATALREINFAWREIWNVDDLPNAIQEITVQFDEQGRGSLPYFVGEPRAVKPNCSRYPVIQLLSPRSQYDESQYIQSPFTWLKLGTSPLNMTLDNVTTLNLSTAEPMDTEFIVTLLGPTDNASEDREQIVFAIGDTTREVTKRFTDLTQAAKDVFTPADVIISTAEDVEVGRIPNAAFEARNTIVQITDKCNTPVCCTPCKCYDVLYKRIAPILYYDEQYIPNGYDEVLMAKTMEWILLPKDDQEKKTLLFADKAKALMAINNENETQGMRRKLDLGRNPFTSTYHGYL